MLVDRPKLLEIGLGVNSLVGRAVHEERGIDGSAADMTPNEIDIEYAELSLYFFHLRVVFFSLPRKRRRCTEPMRSPSGKLRASDRCVPASAMKDSGAPVADKMVCPI